MNIKPSFMLFLTLLAGFLGGMISGRLMTGNPAYAVSSVTKVIKAQEFRLVDKDGNILASLGVAKDVPNFPAETALRIYDDLGMKMLSAEYGNVATQYFIGHHKMGEYGALACNFWDDGERLRVSINNLNDEGPSFNLYDSSKSLRAALGNTSLRNTETGSTENRSESSLVLFKENGTILWEAP